MDAFGHLVFQRIPTRLYSLKEVRQAFHDEGVPITHIPKGRDPVKAFQKACTKIARQWKNQTDSNGNSVRVSVTQVEDNERYIQRDIVQETVKGTIGVDNYAQNTFVGSIAKMILRKSVLQSTDADDPKRIMKAMVMQTNGKTAAQLVADGTWAPCIDYAAMMDEIITMTESMSKNVVDDQAVRKALIPTLKGFCSATAYMDFRGVMIVPDGKMGNLRKVMRAVTKLGIMIHSVPIYEDGDSTGEVIKYLTQTFSDDMAVLREQMGNETSFRRKPVREKVIREVKQFEDMVNQYKDACPEDVQKTLGKELMKTTMALDEAKQKKKVEDKRREAEKKRKADAVVAGQ